MAKRTYTKAEIDALAQERDRTRAALDAAWKTTKGQYWDCSIFAIAESAAMDAFDAWNIADMGNETTD